MGNQQLISHRSIKLKYDVKHKGLVGVDQPSKQYDVFKTFLKRLCKSAKRFDKTSIKRIFVDSGRRL